MFLKPWLEMRIPKMARSRWMCSTSPSMDTSGIHCQTQKILQNTSWEHARLHDHWKRKYQSVSSITQSCPSLYDPLVAASQASLSITNSQSLFKLMSIESVMPSYHLIHCYLLLLTLIFPSIKVFSNESVLHISIRWPNYWSFSFSISPSNEYSGLISFRIDWLDLLPVQGTLRSLFQHRSSKASILGTQLSLWSNSHIHTWLLEKP